MPWPKPRKNNAVRLLCRRRDRDEDKGVMSQMADSVAVSISVLALAVSATTAWLTLFRRGTVKMTQPTVIYFGPDAPRARDVEPPPKVYLRTLLFSTSIRGRVIESMHVSLTRNETHQTFNIWVYGDDNLVRGSGLFVGENGVAANHHFLTPKDGGSFQFSAGLYRFEVYARLLGDRCPNLLFSQELEIAPHVAAALKEPGTGVYFDWGAESSRYLPHVDKRLPSPDAEAFLEAMGMALRSTRPLTDSRAVSSEPPRPASP